MKNYSVKFKNGNEAINGKDYTFNILDGIFSALRDNLIIELSNYDNIKFNYRLFNSVLYCGDNCTINCIGDNELYLGKNCLIKDYWEDNIINRCKENCKVVKYNYYTSIIYNQFYIPTKYKIKTTTTKIGFEIVK